MDRRPDRHSISMRLYEIQQRHPDELIQLDAVIEDARDPDSPLHSLFEWDVDKLALQALRQRARQVIKVYSRAYSVTEEVYEYQMPPSAPIMVRDPDARHHEQGYIPITRVLSDRDRAQRVLAQEFGRALSALNRATEYAELLGVGPKVGSIIQDIQEMIDRLGEEGIGKPEGCH